MISGELQPMTLVEDIDPGVLDSEDEERPGLESQTVVPTDEPIAWETEAVQPPLSLELASGWSQDTERRKGFNG